LDVALELGIPCGGWGPKGRLAEDGAIPLRYPLTEREWSGYLVRTEMNVKNSDGTFILTRGPVTCGTAKTLKLARKLQKTHLVIDLARGGEPESVKKWITESGVRILNMAGPRESKCPGIHDQAVEFLRKLFRG